MKRMKMKRAALITTILTIIGYVIAIISTSGDAAFLSFWALVCIIAIVKIARNERSKEFGVFFFFFGSPIGAIFYLIWNPDKETQSPVTSSTTENVFGDYDDDEENELDDDDEDDLNLEEDIDEEDDDEDDLDLEEDIDEEDDDGGTSSSSENHYLDPGINSGVEDLRGPISELKISKNDSALTLGDLKELLLSGKITIEEYSKKAEKILKV